MLGEEKWLNVMGEPMESSSQIQLSPSTINLKEIPSDELTIKRSLSTVKKSRKNAYFVLDANTTLSDEDIQYQLINTSDTLNKKQLIPELLKRDTKISDTTDKLFKLPERCLSSKLDIYYKKNLKPLKKVQDDNMMISYSDIQNEVQNLIENRKKRQTNPHMPLDDYSNHICTIGDIQTEIKQEINDTMEKHDGSILTKLDMDFKPRVLLSTKTYSRKKRK